MRVTLHGSGAVVLALVVVGCDPTLNIEGSFFPAWIVAMVMGLALTLVARYVFALLRLEPHLGPLVLIYPSLGLLFTLVTWLVLYRT